jgi:hypothetical protein
LGQSEDAIVMRWESALSISLTIAAGEMGALPTDPKTAHSCEKVFDLIYASHVRVLTFWINIVAGFFRRLDAGQTAYQASRASVDTNCKDSFKFGSEFDPAQGSPPDPMQS